MMDQLLITGNTWFVQMICCDRDVGTREFDRWVDADRFRQAYANGGRLDATDEPWNHQRVGILSRVTK